MSNEKKGFTDLSLKHLISKIKSTFINKEDVVSTSTIDVDTTPTEDSENLVTSGGVAEALKNKVNAVAGKGLSTYDFDILYKSRVDSIIPLIKATTPPTTNTQGVVGQLYLDSGHSRLYVCTDMALTTISIVYTWKELTVSIDQSYNPNSVNPQSGQAVAEAISHIKQFDCVVASTLPTPSADTKGKIYFIPRLQEELEDNSNIYDEYITIEISETYSWEKIGSTEVDFSNYYTKEEINENFPTKTEVSTEIAESIEENTDPKGTLTIDGTEYTASKQTITIVTNGVTSTFDICTLS